MILSYLLWNNFKFKKQNLETENIQNSSVEYLCVTMSQE